MPPTKQAVAATRAPHAPRTFLGDEARALGEAFAQLRANLPALLLVTLLAAALRFFQLSQPSLWMDEIVIFREAYSQQYKTVSYETHAAHLAPVSWIMRTFGHTEFWLRFWGAGLGTLAVPLFFVAFLIGWGPAAALTMGLLAALSPYLILYAQDANYYGGMTFYTALHLLCYVMLFRGMPHLALVTNVLVGVVSFYNHPISGIPAAVTTGGMLLAVAVFPALRRDLFVLAPAQWLRRPLVPLGTLGTLGALLFVYTRWAGIKAFVLRLFASEGEGLTNVTPGVGIIIEHLVAFGITFSRPGPLEHSLWPIPALLLAGSLVALAAMAWRRRDPLTTAWIGLALVLPVASFFVLFNLQLNRNYNIRYFTFLAPVLYGCWALAGVAVARALRDDLAPRQLLRLALVGAAIPLALFTVYTARYHLTNKLNYKAGMTYLKANRQPGDRLFVPTRNDLVAARFHLEKYGLPFRSPDLAHFRVGPFADLHSGPFPVLMNGEDRLWIMSGWRDVSAPRLYSFLREALGVEFRGTSKITPNLDLMIHRWDYGSRVLYPHAAARFTARELRSGPILVAGAGEWTVVSSHDPGSANALNFDRPVRLLPADFPLVEGTPDDALITMTPRLPARVILTPDQSINWPEHTRYRLVPDQPRTAVRSEFDVAYDFLVHQPEAAPRHLILHAMRRDEADPLVTRQGPAVPPGLMLMVAVNGRHLGTWSVESGAPEWVAIPIVPDLAPGNHRISVFGTMPRADYTPKFPWVFGGIDWVEGPAAEPVASLEAQGRLAISAGPPAPLVMTTDGTTLDAAWQVLGTMKPQLDTTIRGLDGGPTMRLDYPADYTAPVTVVSAGFPVTPGTIAMPSLAVRLRGLEHHEITPVVVFLKSSGRMIGTVRFMNGGNLRGDTFGKGWVRRVLATPVPEGAEFMAVGIQTYPVPGGETNGGSIWISAPAGAAMTGITQADLALPMENYFWQLTSQP